MLLLAFGIFIEPLPGIVVLVPILAPIAHALGINDLQFGIIVIVNLTMGMITPPVGGLLFVTSIVATVPLARLVARAVAVPVGADRRAGAAVARPGLVLMAARGVRLPLSS